MVFSHYSKLKSHYFHINPHALAGTTNYERIMGCEEAKRMVFSHYSKLISQYFHIKITN